MTEFLHKFACFDCKISFKRQATGYTSSAVITVILRYLEVNLMSQSLLKTTLDTSKGLVQSSSG